MVVRPNRDYSRGGNHRGIIRRLGYHPEPICGYPPAAVVFSRAVDPQLRIKRMVKIIFMRRSLCFTSLIGLRKEFKPRTDFSYR